MKVKYNWFRKFAVVIIVCLFVDCNNNKVESDIDFIKKEILQSQQIKDVSYELSDTSNLNGELISNWSYNHKIEIINYANETYRLAGLSPVLLVKYMGKRYVYYSKNKETILTKSSSEIRANQVSFCYLNQFINSIPFFQDKKISKHEKIALIKKLYLWTIGQKVFLSNAAKTVLPTMYFFNLRNIFVVKDFKELDRIVIRVIYNHEYYMPLLPSRSDFPNEQLKKPSYYKNAFDSAITKHSEIIEKQQRRMLHELQFRKHLIESEMKNKNNFFYISLPNMALHMVKIYSIDDKWFVVGIEVNRKSDNGYFYTRDL